MNWRLGHRPGLDGLRGLAILMVLLAHFDKPTTNPLTGAGVVGVTLFFTLSGFLITALLLGEHDRTGQVSLRRFYVRRARRLLPALAAAALACVLLQSMGRHMGLSGGMLVSVALYFSNYWQLNHPGLLNALSHTWSLAIEEQFYLVWPLLVLLALRFGRRGVWAIGTTGALASMVAACTSSGRLQEWGSIQRAWGLLAGCLLALWMTNRPEGAGSKPVVTLGLLALVPFCVMRDQIPTAAYLLVVPVLGSVILWACAQGSRLTWLEHPVVCWFGTRSYGLYLWHYVVIFALPTSAHLWVVTDLTLIPLSLLAAEASWRLVERWFRHRPSGATRPQTVRSGSQSVRQ